MALRVWLPLNGTLENKGISEYTSATLGSASYTNGKIGQCLTSTTELTTYITHPDTMDLFYNNKYLTLCCWLKLTHNKASGWIIRAGAGNGGTEARGLWWSDSTARYVWNEGDGGQSVISGASTVAADYTNWHHLAIVVDKTDSSNVKKYCYLDGIYQQMVSKATTTAMVENYNIYLNSNLALMNDVRIYDHLLSAKEVKEIAQGLILHYKLDGLSGGASDNILLKTNQGITNWNFNLGNKYNQPIKEEITWLGVRAMKATTQSLNDSYTSEWALVYYNDQSLFSKLKTNTKYTISFDSTVHHTSFPVRQGNGQYDMGENYTYSQTQLTDENGETYWHMVETFTTKSTFEGTGQYVYISSNMGYINTAGNVVKYANIKCEEEEIDTPWTPAPEDLGIDTTKIVDSSGYGNDGTIYGSLSVKNQDTRYNKATFFDNGTATAGSNYILTPAGSFNWFDFGQSTITAWICPTEGKSGWSGTIGVSHDGTNASKSWGISNYGNKLTGHTTNNAWVNNQSTGSLPVDEWHFIAGTLDGTTQKLYLDGELVKTSTITWPASPTPRTDYRFECGVDMPGTNETFTGYYSDVRFYVTVLSEEDIKDLYHTPANIDNLGGIHGFEFNETNTNSLSDFSLNSSNWVSDGVTSTYSVEEMGPMVKIVPSSSNKRIYHNVSNVWVNQKTYLVSMIAKADANNAVLRASRSIADFAPDFILTTEWKKYYGIITSTTTASGGTLSISCPTSTNYYITDIKLEEADKNLISILKTGSVKENWIDQNNFNNNAKFLKQSSIIIGNNFIEK